MQCLLGDDDVFLSFLCVLSAFCDVLAAISMMNGACTMVCDSDRVLFVPFNEVCECEYALGSVWMRKSASCDDPYLYYLSVQEGRPHCYRFVMRKESPWPEELNSAFDDLRLFADSDKPLLDFLSQKYPPIYEVDMVSALVQGIKAAVVHEVGLLDGDSSPYFGSFACYTFAYDRKPSDKIIRDCGGELKHGRGSIWIRKEDDGRQLLCYWPLYGPEWLCYRYDLNLYLYWRSEWDSSLCALRRFAESQSSSLNECVSDVAMYQFVVMAMFSGYGGFDNENVWFSYMSSGFSNFKEVSVMDGDALIRGDLIFPGGQFYACGAVWMRSRCDGTQAWYYRSKKTVFRFLPNAPEVGDSLCRMTQQCGAQEAWIHTVYNALDPKKVGFVDRIVPRNVCCAQEGDKIICLASKRYPGCDYQAGDMWLRLPKNGCHGVHLYWISSVDGDMFFNEGRCRHVNELCFTITGECWPESLQELFPDIKGFLSSKELSLHAFMRVKYPNVAATDLVCAVTLGLQGVSQENAQICLDGSLNERFKSWGRYVPAKGAPTSRKVLVLRESSDQFGAVFVRRGEENILCYRPNFGPKWLE